MSLRYDDKKDTQGLGVPPVTKTLSGAPKMERKMGRLIRAVCGAKKGERRRFNYFCFPQEQTGDLSDPTTKNRATARDQATPDPWCHHCKDGH